MKLPFFLDPRFWLAFLIWTGLVVFGAYAYGHSEAKETAKHEESGRTALALAGQKLADDKELAKERKLRADDRTAHEKYIKEKEDADAAKTRTTDCLRAGTCVMRVPIRAPRKAEAVASGPAAAGPVEEGSAELTPNAGSFLVDLLARGDEGIRKHGEVVDRYERLRTACMLEPEPVLP